MKQQLLSGETLGIEFETDNVLVESISTYPKINSLKETWSTHQDASIQTDIKYFSLKKGIPSFIIKNFDSISKKKSLLGLDSFILNSTSGVEFVSNILDSNNINNIENVIDILLEFLNYCGEPPTSERAGIHYHITIPTNLKILKSVIKLALHLEDVFFAIGGFGYENRGNKNYYTYCRPISMTGPPCIINSWREGRTGVQVFTTERLLQATSVEDFYKIYFGTNETMGERYVPQRYCWINLFSIPTKGSLEFRIFNKTLNSDYILASLEFCLKFVNCVLLNSLDVSTSPEFDIINSVYTKRNKKELVDTFLNFAQVTKISSKSQKILVSLLEKSFPIIINNEYTFSHLKRTDTPSDWVKTLTDADYIPINQIEKPKYVDIHVLRGEDGQENDNVRRIQIPHFDLHNPLPHFDLHNPPNDPHFEIRAVNPEHGEIPIPEVFVEQAIEDFNINPEPERQN